MMFIIIKQQYMIFWRENKMTNLWEETIAKLSEMEEFIL